MSKDINLELIKKEVQEMKVLIAETKNDLSKLLEALKIDVKSA